MLNRSIAPSRPRFTLFVHRIIHRVAAGTKRGYATVQQVVIPRTLIGTIDSTLITQLRGIIINSPTRRNIGVNTLMGTRRHTSIRRGIGVLLTTKYRVHLNNRTSLSTTNTFFPPALLCYPRPSRAPTMRTARTFNPITALVPTRGRQRTLRLTYTNNNDLTKALIATSPRVTHRFVTSTTHARKQVRVLGRRSTGRSAKRNSPLPRLMRNKPNHTKNNRRLNNLQTIGRCVRQATIRNDPAVLTTVDGR